MRYKVLRVHVWKSVRRWKQLVNSRPCNRKRSLIFFLFPFDYRTWSSIHDWLCSLCPPSYYTHMITQTKRTLLKPFTLQINHTSVPWDIKFTLYSSSIAVLLVEITDAHLTRSAFIFVRRGLNVTSLTFKTKHISWVSVCSHPFHQIPRFYLTGIRLQARFFPSTFPGCSKAVVTQIKATGYVPNRILTDSLVCHNSTSPVNAFFCHTV